MLASGRNAGDYARAAHGGGYSPLSASRAARVFPRFLPSVSGRRGMKTPPILVTGIAIIESNPDALGRGGLVEVWRGLKSLPDDCTLEVLGPQVVTPAVTGLSHLCPARVTPPSRLCPAKQTARAAERGSDEILASLLEARGPLPET